MINFDTAKSNLIKMYYNPDAIYAVGENNELETISKWNLVGRLYHYLDGTSNKTRVSELVKNSAEKVFQEIKPSTSFFADPGGVFFYTWEDPFYSHNISLATLTFSLLFNNELVKENSDIKSAVNDLWKKCMEIHQQIKSSGTGELLNKVFGQNIEWSGLNNSTAIKKAFQEYSLS